jgi:D-alanine--poly(phosphoribitol) ligase, subunit 2
MQDKILDILENICGDEIVKENLDINLLEEDLIDSLDYVTLLLDIQDEFGVVLSPSEFTREEMDTPNKIIETLSKRLKQ